MILVYDKKTGKVVEETKSTQYKQRSAYIKKKFIGMGIKNKQLAPSLTAWERDDPACYFTSFDDLDRKARASGQIVNAYNNDGGE